MNSQKQVIVIGANGQLGNEIRTIALQYSAFDFNYVDIGELDICDEKAVSNYFKEHIFDYCINCAAYTAVDKAESEQNKASEINLGGTKHIHAACKIHDTFLFHISTDFVFDGKNNVPYDEDAVINPISVYGKTKAAGERVLKEGESRYMIIRTSWLYSTFGNNFVKTMLRLGKEKDSLNVVYDQTGTPTNAADLAAAILQIMQKLDQKQSNFTNKNSVYHFSNEGVTSWYDFAKEIIDFSGLPCYVVPIETHQYPTPAKRPPYSVLNKAKIKQEFGLEISHWKDALHECLKKLKEMELK